MRVYMELSQGLGWRLLVVSSDVGVEVGGLRSLGPS